MDFGNFSAKWFALYYFVVGVCLLGSGFYLIIKKKSITDFLLSASDDEQPPRFFIRILKYFLLFTLPGLLLSFMPFSWIELLFTLWSLLLVYIAGLQLVRWDQNRKLIKARSKKLPAIIRRCGAIMVAVGLAIFLLAYFVIKRASF